MHSLSQKKNKEGSCQVYIEIFFCLIIELL